MKCASLALALAVLAAGCGSSSTAPTGPSNTVTFTAQLLPANETPPIANAESVASGSVTIVFNLTRDGSGNVTSAVANFNANFSNLPQGSAVTIAHIHTGAVGVKGDILITATPAAPPAVTNGAGSFTQTANVSGTDATNIINNPSGFYFNIHTALNPGGVMRGQLVKQ